MITKSFISQLEMILSPLNHSTLFSRCCSFLMLRVGSPKKTSLRSDILRINDKFNPHSFENGFSFWNASHLELNLPRSITNRDYVANPYKPYELIRKSLQKGINRMVVCDEDEVKKIYQMYQGVSKQTQIQRPQFIYKVQDFQYDFWMLKKFKNLNIPVSGLLFSAGDKQFSQIEQFRNDLSSMNIHVEENIVELSYENYNRYKISKPEFTYEILDYGETDNYLMMCRIIGQDQNGNYIFPDDCYEYICDRSYCCRKNIQVSEIMHKNDQKWALIRPKKLRDIPSERIFAIA